MRMKRFLICSLILFLFSVSEGGEVLWDISHGFELFAHPDTIHSRFQEMVEEEGITVVVSDTGVLNLDLSQFEGLILATATSYRSFYTSEEVSAIETFVTEGGGLLILGDNWNFRPDHMNPVAQTFGTTLGDIGSFIPQPYTFFLFIPHPIFEDVTEILFAYGSGLIAEPPSIIAAWDFLDIIAVTVAEAGQGRVVMTGDENVFTDYPPHYDPNRCCIFEVDNEVFARNVIHWLWGRGHIQATVDIKPNVLNRKSQGRWITAYIELPGSRDPTEIDVSRTYLTYQEDSHSAELWPTEVGDYDGDGIQDRMVKFDRASVIEMLDKADVPQDVILTISGELTGGIPFSGEDMIRIIEPGNQKEVSEVSNLKVTPNPFSSSTRFQFSLSDVGAWRHGAMPEQQLAGSEDEKISVKLSVYDITGKIVKTLLDSDFSTAQLESGISVEWDGEGLNGEKVPSGVYFYRLTAGNKIAIRKIVVLK